jgi:polar amino acid transport system substrate-binding protein
MLNVEGIDAVMTTNNQVFELEKLSDVYITYQNVAISLKSNNYSITSIADLAKYTIASFKKSKKVLGQEFDKAASQSPLFMEISNQQSQLGLLTKKRVQLAIMDKNIFNYYLQKQKLSHEFTFYPVFPSNPYRMAFRKNEHIDRFNQSLKKFLSSNKYDDLLKKYKF